MKARDPNDILREEGEDAVRAAADGTKPFEPKRKAQGNDDDFGPDESAQRAKGKKNGPATTTDGVRPPEFSDDALALRFADRHVGSLRYVATHMSTWLYWDGTRWQPDHTLRAFSYSRLICRAVAASCNHPKLRKEPASAKTVAAVERLARSDRRLVDGTPILDCSTRPTV